jgi:hypothetical protein
MQTLGLGIALLIIGLIIGILPFFGVLAGPIMWLGWVLVVVGIILGIIHFVTGRTGPGRAI